MANATEICFLPLKEGEYPVNWAAPQGEKVKEILSTIVKQGGAQRMFHGQQVEHPNIFTLFIDWDSVDHHEKFMAWE